MIMVKVTITIMMMIMIMIKLETRVMSSEQMENSFTNCPPCLLADTAKMACLVAGPPKYSI